MTPLNKIKWLLIKFLITTAVIILIVSIGIDQYKEVTAKQLTPARYIHNEEDINESVYIISKEMIMSKLEAKSQIVSLQQDLHKTETIVEDGLLGERRTELEINGTYKMGLNTEDIVVKNIDSKSGTVYIELPDPILISLELPYDELSFNKTQGFFRFSMSEEEQKDFYKSTADNIRVELLHNEELMKTADLYNQGVIEEILLTMSEIKYVHFE